MKYSDLIWKIILWNIICVISLNFIAKGKETMFWGTIIGVVAGTTIGILLFQHSQKTKN
jgi:hypothetical protein